MLNTNANCNTRAKLNRRKRRTLLDEGENRNPAKQAVIDAAIAHKEALHSDPVRQQEDRQRRQAEREAREAEQARQAALGSRRRRTQARMDEDRTEAQKAAARSGRKSAAKKKRRSEAWWAKVSGHLPTG